MFRTNGGSVIDALGPDDVVVTDGNGTMTVVTKPKREDRESKDGEKQVDEEKEEKKERRRREAAEDTVAEASEERKNHKPVSVLQRSAHVAQRHIVVLSTHTSHTYLKV